MIRAAADIALDRVSKRYGHTWAVRDVSLRVAAGSLVTLLGPSGCGKTTLLRIIAGLELPTAGTVAIAGADVSLKPAAERDVSMVFQSYALFPHMDVLANVAYGPRVAGAPAADARSRAEAALALVGLAGYGARLPSELSGGQQQRVAVARALVVEPSVLLFDEPLSNLDARLRRSMRTEIRSLQSRLGLTVVYVTHDQAEALAISDRIVVMHEGAIAQEGTPRELYRAPRNRFVAGFIGDANLLRARVVAGAAGRPRLLLGDCEIELDQPGLPAGEVEIAVRPEAIALRAPQAPGGLAGRLATVSYLGSHAEFTVATELGELFVTAPAAAHRPGDAVTVHVDPQGICVLA
jgi:iron(III) transport system ATP-binding protein